MYILRYEEQAHMYDYIAGVYSTKELAEAAMDRLLADEELCNEHSIYRRYTSVEELPAVDSKEFVLHTPRD